MLANLHILAPVAAFIEALDRNDKNASVYAIAPEGSVDDGGRITTGTEEVTVAGDGAGTHANDPSDFTFTVTGGRSASTTVCEA